MQRVVVAVGQGVAMPAGHAEGYAGCLGTDTTTAAAPAWGEVRKALLSTAEGGPRTNGGRNE